MIGSVTWIFAFYLFLGASYSYALEHTCMGMENTRTKQYRKDYVYSPKNDVFYKQHTEIKDYMQARDLCNNEGAELMVPSSWHDVMQLDEIIKKYPKLESMWIGDSQSTANSLDKEPQSNHKQHKALTRNATIVDVLTTKQLPFICKVKADDAPFNSQCNVHGKEYQYMAATKSCYKISGFLMTWDEAYLECQNEGSHLVILNSKNEQEVVWDLVKKMISIPDTNYLSAGFKALKTPKDVRRIFRTIIFKYQYMAATKSCYKISGFLMTWDEAYLECQNEGSHLVILNSKNEQEVVWDLVKKMISIPDTNYLSAGFKALKTPKDVRRIFRTIIFNETLEEAGYNEWAKYQPNNAGGVEYCGSFYKSEGKLNDVSCTVSHRLYNFAYICEKELQT